MSSLALPISLQLRHSTLGSHTRFWSSRRSRSPLAAASRAFCAHGSPARHDFQISTSDLFQKVQSYRKRTWASRVVRSLSECTSFSFSSCSSDSLCWPRLSVDAVASLMADRSRSHSASKSVSVVSKRFSWVSRSLLSRVSTYACKECYNNTVRVYCKNKSKLNEVWQRNLFYLVIGFCFFQFVLGKHQSVFNTWKFLRYLEWDKIQMSEKSRNKIWYNQTQSNSATWFNSPSFWAIEIFKSSICINITITHFNYSDPIWLSIKYLYSTLFQQ